MEKLLRDNGKSLKDFDCMPHTNFDDIKESKNILLFNELNIDTDSMKELHDNHFSKLNIGQRKVYDEVVDAINNKIGGFFFVYGYGGTGKTFVWKSLTFKLHSEKKMVLNVASSGIASLLLLGGRTAHSQFSIPLSLNEDTCSNIRKSSMKAELLQYTSLIIWDEAPMVNKWAFEALDRTLRDIMQSTFENNRDWPFRGKIVVLGSDCRQILPVIVKANYAKIVMAAVNSSYLWKHYIVLSLTENMRLKSSDKSVDMNKIEEFGKWLLDVGKGKRGVDNDGELDIQILTELLIPKVGDPIQDIVSDIYPNLYSGFDDSFFEDRAILAPKLEIIDTVNSYVLSLIPGDQKIYFSANSVCKVDEDVNIISSWLTTEFLNDIRCSGLPNHKLVLKKGVPIMLMRNIVVSSGLCNGSRLIVRELGSNIIGAKMITRDNFGKKIYIPCMNLIPSDQGVPIKFQ